MTEVKTTMERPKSPSKKYSTMSTLKRGYVKTVLKNTTKKFTVSSSIGIVVDLSSILFTNKVVNGWNEEIRAASYSTAFKRKTGKPCQKCANLDVNGSSFV